MEENTIENIDLEKMRNILASLDDSGDLEDLITEDIQANIDDPELDVNMYYDELGEAVYEPVPNIEAIKAEIARVITEPLTKEEIEFLTTIISNNICHKVNAKKNASRKAYYRCEEPDMIDRYGSKSSAFDHIYDNLMYELGFVKPLESSFEDYIEYLGIKTK